MKDKITAARLALYTAIPIGSYSQTVGSAIAMAMNLDNLAMSYT